MAAIRDDTCARTAPCVITYAWRPHAIARRHCTAPPPRHHNNCEVADAALEKEDWTQRLLAKAARGEGKHGHRRKGPVDIAPISAESIWNMLDERLAREKAAKGGSSDEEDEHDIFAGLEPKEKTTALDDLLAADEPLPKFEDGTLLEALEHLAHSMDKSLEELWRDQGARGPKGGIEVDKLQKMLGAVLEITPDSRETRYLGVLLDPSGQGRITLGDVRSAGAQLAHVRGGRLVVPKGGKVRAEDFMLLMARKARGMRGGLRAMFDHFDRDGSGDIDWKEAAQMVSALVPGLSDAEKRAVLMRLMGDRSGAGGITLAEFEDMLRPFEAQLDRPGAHVLGTARRSARGQHALRQVLEGLAALAKAEAKRRGSARAPLTEVLFAKCAKSGTGKLTWPEVHRMVEVALPGSSREDARSLWLLLDLNGDGGVTREEFQEGLTTVKNLCKSGDGAAPDGSSVFRSVLVRMARRAREAGGAAQYLTRFDSDGSGRLETRELVRMVRDAAPELKDAEIRRLLLGSGALDPNGDGRVDLRELQDALAPFMSQGATQLDVFQTVDDYLNGTGESLQVTSRLGNSANTVDEKPRVSIRRMASAARLADRSITSAVNLERVQLAVDPHHLPERPLKKHTAIPNHAMLIDEPLWRSVPPRLPVQSMWGRYEQQFNGYGGAPGLRMDALGAFLREAARGVGERRGTQLPVSDSQIEYVWKVR